MLKGCGPTRVSTGSAGSTQSVYQAEAGSEEKKIDETRTAGNATSSGCMVNSSRGTGQRSHICRVGTPSGVATNLRPP